MCVVLWDGTALIPRILSSRPRNMPKIYFNALPGSPPPPIFWYISSISRDLISYRDGCDGQNFVGNFTLAYEAWILYSIRRTNSPRCMHAATKPKFFVFYAEPGDPWVSYAKYVLMCPHGK